MSSVYYVVALTAVVILKAVVCEEPRPPYHLKWNRYFSNSALKSDALFGFSIAYYKALDKLMVGSPKMSTTGGVFVCPVADEAAHCDEVNVPLDDKLVSNKHGFWLGATVNAGEDFMMTCAPRFTLKRGNITFTEGRCSYIKPRDKHTKLVLKTMNDNYGRREYHEAAYPDFEKGSYISSELLMDSIGWSSHVNDDGSVLLGGPAMSIGRAIHYYDVKRSPNSIIVNNTELRKEGREVSFNFGYSITSFKYSETDQYFAISTPYGTFGNGRVLLYLVVDGTLDTNSLPEEIKGGEVGCLFGAALAVLRQDGQDSALLVGAPAFAPLGAAADSEGQSYDSGAVYIYKYNNEEFNFELRRIMFGYKNGGYFGHSIASLGDLNLDNVDEVAISAPYEDEGRGVVYIYSGLQLLSNDSTVPWLQRISPEGPPYQYFGRTLYALQDADENGCNELAIGVPGNNSVMLLRCFASVRVQFNAKFPDLTDQTKRLQTSDSSFEYRPCLNVTYTDPDKPKSIDTVIVIMITINHPNVKIRGAHKGSISFSAALKSREPQYCNPITVDLPKEGDYDYPIEFRMMASANKNPLTETKFNPNLVFVDGEKILKTVIPTNLMPESILTYSVSSTLRNNYVIGSTKNETLTMKMRNDGNKAYGACMSLRVRGVQVMGASRVCEQSGERLTCTPHPPLTINNEWNLTVTLITEELTSANETVEIYAEVLKHCMNRAGEPYNNTILLKSDLSVHLNGISSPSDRMNATKKELKEKGKQIEHMYSISNYGVTTGKNLVCEIILPTDPDIIFYVFTGINDECTHNGTVAVCIIKELRQSDISNVRVQMDIRPESSTIEKIKSGEALLVTHFQINLGNDVRRKSLTTVISLWDPKVPLWIIIVAALVGLLLLLLLGWVLHECGCLKRNKKEELENLKQNIKRQSMRRSKMLRESTIEVVRDDLQRLMEEPEDSDLVVTEENNDGRARDAFAIELGKAVRKDTNNTFTARADVH